MTVWLAINNIREKIKLKVIRKLRRKVSIIHSLEFVFDMIWLTFHALEDFYANRLIHGTVELSIPDREVLIPFNL